MMKSSNFTAGKTKKQKRSGVSDIDARRLRQTPEIRLPTPDPSVFAKQKFGNEGEKPTGRDVGGRNYRPIITKLRMIASAMMCVAHGISSHWERWRTQPSITP